MNVQTPIMRQHRRQFLAAAAAVGTLSVAGCSDDSGGESSDSEGDGSDDSASDGSGSGDAPGSVSFDLDIKTENVSQFDSLVVRFRAFELRSEDETVRREGTGEEIELVGLGEDDLLETDVPAGEYTEAAIFLPVVDYESTDGTEGEFTDNEPSLIDLAETEPFAVEEDASVTFLPFISVLTSNEVDGWTFDVSHAAF